MAGIGFELRKLMNRGSVWGLVQAYAYAGIISSGPWVLSIIGILVIGLFSIGAARPDILVSQFQVSITYIIAGSLILTGLVQLAFTRFTADRLFDHENDIILPAFNGLLVLVTLVSGLIGGVFFSVSFPDQSLLYRAFMAGGFVIMCNIWVAAIFLSGMKQYKSIVVVFALGYGISVGLAVYLRRTSLEGIFGGFLAGQLALLLGLIILINLEYPSGKFLSFSFIRKMGLYPSLIFIGLFYNMGVWIDKFMFWGNAYTSVPVIGPLRASPIYDIPVFLAYLSIIPGMAVFLVRLETDFVEYYEKFYEAIRSGQSLAHIEDMRNAMVYTLRQGVFQIIGVQIVVVLAVVLVGSSLLRFLGISDLYFPLLCVNVIAAAIQVVFLGVLTIFFYLDKRGSALLLTFLFVVLNGSFTLVTLLLGPKFYGMGFAAALLVVVATGFYVLDRRLESLEYETFMLQ
jgi:uncharacterized membrane protein